MRNYYQEFYDKIKNNGESIYPSGYATTGMYNQVFKFNSGDVFVRPGGNPNIGYIELIQLIAGTFDIDTFKKITPNARLDLFTHQSAYGPRVEDQIPKIIDELKKDPESRRAVMLIARDNDKPQDMTCTISMQFQIMLHSKYFEQSSPTLCTLVTMRSSDLIWGLPTDMIQFGGVALMLSNILRVDCGTCTVMAGNSHIYRSTELKPGEEFKLAGRFDMPIFSSFTTYKTWAKKKLMRLNAGTESIKQIFPLIKGE